MVFQLVQISRFNRLMVTSDNQEFRPRREFARTPNLLWHKSNKNVNSVYHLFSTFRMSGSRHRVISFNPLWRNYLSCLLFCIWSWIDLPKFTLLFKWQNWVMNRGLDNCKASDFCHHAVVTLIWQLPFLGWNKFLYIFSVKSLTLPYPNAEVPCTGRPISWECHLQALRWGEC